MNQKGEVLGVVKELTLEALQDIHLRHESLTSMDFLQVLQATNKRNP